MLAWLLLLAFATPVPPELEKARDAQDRPALDRIAGQYATAAQQKPKDADAQYRAALAQSYVAEVAIEVRDNPKARDAAEAGIKAAERAVALNGSSSEYHRILGTLCGQVIPAAKLAGISRGRCALDEVNKALQLDSKAAINYLSRGVGNYYLPSAFGGGIELAIKDFQKAIDLDPRSADAHLWMGVALRKAGRNADARKSFQKALDLNPQRVWAKQQLEKTPAK
ncbi:MAG TPA: tetratricopeptide repeat protein [Bryobacteraceae bacterium]|jgi:tetratricopeptide (TPR) repeat protein|nr:tetratricopeptide repeat protein [Bryobacteraceae bacterium]